MITRDWYETLNQLLHDAGGTLSLQNRRLQVIQPRGGLPEPLREEIRIHRASVVAYLEQETEPICSSVSCRVCNGAATKLPSGGWCCDPCQRILSRKEVEMKH
jgi:hypothetical protein